MLLKSWEPEMKTKHSIKTNSIIVLALTLMMIWAYSAVTMPVSADSLGVTTHTKTEIINYLKSNGVSISDPSEFSVEPVKNSVKGELTTATKNSALKMLNNVRYIAGLNTVSLDSTMGGKAQAAAFADFVINSLTHYPGTTDGKPNGPERPKPDGMSDTDWEDGKEGARKSNLAWRSGNASLNYAIIAQWMGDSNASNVARVGHRRWCLNPAMAKTGFGMAGTYTAMWSFDESGSGTQNKVAWPARYMPIEYFGNTDAWCFCTGDTSITDISNVAVTLTRRAASPSGSGSWSFSTSNSYTASGDGEYFGVNINNPYQGYSGQAGPYVIFRPANITYKPGDIFDVRITGLGSQTITYSVEFFNGFPVESVGFDESTYYVSSYKYLYPTTVPSDASDFEMIWESSDPSVATVDANGKVTAVTPGAQTTITVTIPGKYTSTGAAKSASCTVYVPKSVFDGEGITRRITNPEYSGANEKPDIVIKDGDYVLVEGVDYTVSLPEETVEPGTRYTVWIYGKGRYCHNVGMYFYVDKRDLDNCDITISPENYTYNGTLRKPSVTVKNGSLTLAEGTDYTLTNNGGTNAGSYNVRITAPDSSTYYTGTVNKTFTISPKVLTAAMVTNDQPEFVYTGSQVTPAVTVRDGSKILAKGVDYELTADTAVSRGSYGYTVTGKGNYSGSIEGSFTVVPAALTDSNVTLSENSIEYTGSAAAPRETVVFNGKTLTKGTDYNVTADAAVNCGEYTLTVTGRGGQDASCNFTGTVTKTFTITEKPLKAAMIKLDASSFVYKAAVQKPAVTVMDGAKTLTQGTDYTLVNNGGRNAGTYTVQVTAAAGGNYSGTVSAEYTIGPKALTNDMIARIPDRTYDGKDFTPDLSVTFSGENVTFDTVNDGKGRNAGTYTAEIRGKGNYTGNASADYAILPMDIGAAGVSFAGITAEYTGSAVTPAFDITEPTGTITESDYTAAYADGAYGIDAGTYDVVITGKGNFTGTRIESFTVTAKDIADADIKASDITDQVYTGSAIEPEFTLTYGSRTLESSDYMFEYEDNTEVGSASVLITGTGNFTGSRTLNFNIISQKQADDAKEAEITQEIDSYAKENGISQDTLNITDAVITTGNTDSDLKGSAFGLLKAYASKNTKNSITLKWNKVPNADGYVIYGNKCGKGNKCVKLATLAAGKTKFTQKKLKKGTYYKYVIIAFKNIRGRMVTVSATPTIHSVTLGGKYGVAKSVKITKTGTAKGKKALKVTLKKGKKAAVKAAEVKAGKTIKRHRKLAYESSDPAVATVTKKGVIKAVGKGKCVIYVYAQNGVSKAIKITVK